MNTSVRQINEVYDVVSRQRAVDKWVNTFQPAYVASCLERAGIHTSSEAGNILHGQAASTSQPPPVSVAGPSTRPSPKSNKGPSSVVVIDDSDSADSMVIGSSDDD